MLRILILGSLEFMLLYQDNNKRVAIKSIFIRTTEEREKKTGTLHVWLKGEKLVRLMQLHIFGSGLVW